MENKKDGLTSAQEKLPTELKDAILKKKGKKHSDHKEEDLDVDKADINKDGEIEGWEAARSKAIQKNMAKKGKKHMDAEDVEAKDIDKDGKIEGWEKGKAEAIKKALEKKEESLRHRPLLPTFTEWMKQREVQD